MKKFIIGIILGMSLLFTQYTYAEASFSQIQTLIEKQEYRAAEKGLEEIISNHPNSSKAFYAMAQAQAGLGNLTKAQHALDKAIGLNPTLDYAPKASVENLKQAIHPQVAKIEIIEESHFWRNVFLIILVGLIGYLGYTLYEQYSAKAKRKREREKEAQDRYDDYKRRLFESSAKREVKAEVKAPVITTPVAKAVPEVAKVAPVKKSTPASEQLIYPGGGLTQPTPVVVNNNSTGHSATDFMLGAAMGHILTANNSHKEIVHGHTIERQSPVETKSSSWDDTPSTPSRSSSWDSDSSSSRSSSWDDDSSSSSKSSSSWSSSSSDSSSSWDSGSSDSGSSSSSWD